MSGRIIFMGTPDFAVESLKQIVDAGMQVVAVVTTPDKPAGRGQLVQQSAVKQFAVEQKLTVLQPEKLKDPHFLNELAGFKADLFVVVAFRMLPEVVWNMPPLGTINLHGSLLPQYRGAAPINWAVIHGETETGATTFFIEKEIDTGRIIDHVKIPISETDNAGNIHDRLMVEGAQLLCRTVDQILNHTVSSKSQAEWMNEAELKHAPKIFKPDCKIDWKATTRNCYNKIRGLSPYPTAWTEIVGADAKPKSLKIFETKPHWDEADNSGEIKWTNQTLYFGTIDGWLEIIELQLEGKKRMSAAQFLQGFKLNGYTLVMQ